MTADPTAADFSPDLFQDENGLFIAPVRHHSPACAWALRQMIRDIRPARVLIEAPADLTCHIPLLLDQGTVPPVALVAVGQGKARRAAYYPFTCHSPEYVALQEGAKLGAKLQFIDLPLDDRKDDQDHPAQPLTVNETHFDSGDYINALCARLGCRDGFALWDHLFEARLGTSDWRSFFADCGTYCAGIRAATAQASIDASGDGARETFMARAIASALADGAGPVVVVAGGFHAPALTRPPKAQHPVNDPPIDPLIDPLIKRGKSYLIRYGYGAMDALAGYGAGLPQPGYYDTLWQAALAADGTPDWAATNADIVGRFDRWLATHNQHIPLPAKVEALRMAAGLAALRGRAGALRHDLMDGLTTALVKGESGRADIWQERLVTFLRGTTLGDTPPAAGAPPLVEDTRARARALRFDLSDGAERRRKLDIWRKPRQLAASQFLHALSLLDVGFARRTAGPDFVQGAQTHLLFEDWTYAWSPGVEARLTDAAILADKLPDACIARLHQARDQLQQDGHARDLTVLVDYLLKGLLAGLGARLTPYLDGLAGDIQRYGTFQTVAAALRRLNQITNARGPLRAPDSLDLAGAETAAFQRLVYLCDDLQQATKDTIPAQLDALRIMNELLAAGGGDRLDRSSYDAALARLAHGKTPPEILGAILSSAMLAGQSDAATLATALAGNFNGVALDHSARIAALRGLLATAPQLLWHHSDVLAVVDGFLGRMPEDAFIALLPHLRLAFTELNPRETDRLADMLGAIHGVAGHGFVPGLTGLSQTDLDAGLAAEQALRAELDADGLGDWAAP